MYTCIPHTPSADRESMEKYFKVCVCICTYMHIYMYVCMRVCVYMYALFHTTYYVHMYTTHTPIYINTCTDKQLGKGQTSS